MRLAEHDGAGRAQLRDDLCVDRRRGRLRARRAARAGGQARDVDHVLDGNRHAMQRSAQRAGAPRRTQYVCLRERAFAIDDAPALHLRFDGIDAAKALTQHISNADRTASDGGGESVIEPGSLTSGTALPTPAFLSSMGHQAGSGQLLDGRQQRNPGRHDAAEPHRQAQRLGIDFRLQSRLDRLDL